MLRNTLLAVGVLVLASGGAASAAAQCYPVNTFGNWRAPDEKTIIMKTGVSSYIRLDLANRCSMLREPAVHLVTKFDTTMVCTPLDWNLSVAQEPGSSVSQACIVKAMTPLTPQEAAALPAKFRP
jgi:hypothetical protein